MAQAPTQYRDQLYVPPKFNPVRDQKEEDPRETEKGEDEKKDWPKP
jgi:hypothetical protein